MFVTIIIVMLGYGLIHSWLASIQIKNLAKGWLGEQRYFGFYRAAYNLAAIVTLCPILGLVIFQPGNIVWQVTGIAQIALHLIQIVGVIGVFFSLTQIDLGEFLGLTQIMAYHHGEMLPLPLEPLQIAGLYQFVRHPLYLFSLMVIWPMPTMTESLLAFNIAATIYFLVGSIYEERKLILIYGDGYRKYQRETPSMIPFVKIFREF